jgi:hypothetical protein
LGQQAAPTAPNHSNKAPRAASGKPAFVFQSHTRRPTISRKPKPAPERQEPADVRARRQQLQQFKEQRKRKQQEASEAAAPAAARKALQPVSNRRASAHANTLNKRSPKGPNRRRTTGCAGEGGVGKQQLNKGWLKFDAGAGGKENAPSVLFPLQFSPPKHPGEV